MATLLEVRNVSKQYRKSMLNRTGTIALEPMSLAISEDEPSVTVVAGESGSGKTTLANLLLGIIEPTSGQILYRGKDPAKMSARERMAFRREVQAIFQDPFEAYNPFHKVDRVLKTPLRKFKLASSEAERKKLIDQALDLVGLRPEDTLGRYPHQLSGGQRQRIMVARALLVRPRIIIADEPVSMVDASLRASILESLLRLTRELGISLVYITHDLTTAYQVGDTAIILYRGAIAELGMWISSSRSRSILTLDSSWTRSPALIRNSAGARTRLSRRAMTRQTSSASAAGLSGAARMRCRCAASMSHRSSARTTGAALPASCIGRPRQCCREKHLTWCGKRRGPLPARACE
jgi:ABC-type glutathione transport system ATPase component